MNIRLLERTPFEPTADTLDAAGNERTWLVTARQCLHNGIERAYYDESKRMVVFPPTDEIRLPTYCWNDEGVASTVRFLFTDSFTRACPYTYEAFQEEWKLVDIEAECGPGLCQLREAIYRAVPNFPGTKEELEKLKVVLPVDNEPLDRALAEATSVRAEEPEDPKRVRLLPKEPRPKEPKEEEYDHFKYTGLLRTHYVAKRCYYEVDKKVVIFPSEEEHDRDTVCESYWAVEQKLAEEFVQGFYEECPRDDGDWAFSMDEGDAGEYIQPFLDKILTKLHDIAPDFSGVKEAWETHLECLEYERKRKENPEPESSSDDELDEEELALFNEAMERD